MIRPILTAVAAIALLSGCQTTQTAQTASRGARPASAICVLHGTKGHEKVSGTVTFRRQDDGVLVDAVVSGLTPGKHGFHVHEFGDTNCPDGTCTGGHFNPGNMPHAGPDAAQRHVGDLGNLVAGADGTARYRRVDRHISLDMASPSCIIGRAIIVHADEDDLTSQPTGAAGARLAAGVIGVGKE